MGLCSDYFKYGSGRLYTYMYIYAFLLRLHHAVRLW